MLVGSALGLTGVPSGHRAGLVILTAVTAAGWTAALWVWGSGPLPEGLAVPANPERASTLDARESGGTRQTRRT